MRVHMHGDGTMHEMVEVDHGERCVECQHFTSHDKPSEHPCASCGVAGFETNRLDIDGHLTRMLLNNTCFLCQFWLDVIDAMDHHVVIEGTAWAMRPDEPEFRKAFGGWGLGCGGRHHLIRKLDGTVIECNNLWCRGDVPERFRDRLPDDAEFLPREVAR